MFPKSSLIMVLVASLMLLAACLINYFNDKEINNWYLGIGIVLFIFSTAMFIFKRK